MLLLLLLLLLLLELIKEQKKKSNDFEVLLCEPKETRKSCIDDEDLQ